jgi:hypothetical protein
MTAQIQSPDLTLIAYLPASTDITGDLLKPIFGEWGMGNEAEDRLAGTGTIEFDMDNVSTVGKYQPNHSNCLSGWQKGTVVEFTMTYDGASRTWRRYVDSCVVSGTREERIHVTAVSWLEYAAKYPVVSPDLLENATVDEGIAELLSAFPIPPQDTNLQTGTNKFPTLLDTVTRYTKAYTELSKFANSELGYIYENTPEILVFRNMLHRNGTNTLSQIPIASSELHSLTNESNVEITDENDATLLADESEDLSISTANGNILTYENDDGANIVNRFTTTSNPRRTDETPITLFEPERPIFVSSGGRWKSREYWTDSVSRRSINAIPPVQDNHTKVLLRFIGTNGSQQSFDDDVTGRLWIANDVELVSDVFGTAPKFQNTCAYLDGSNSYIYTAHSPIFELGTQDWTFSIWAYTFATTSGRTLINRDGTIATPPYRFFRSDGTNYRIDISSNGSSFDIANGRDAGTITTGEWVYHEIGRSGSNFYVFKNGVLTDTFTSSASIYASLASFMLGRNQTTYFDGTLAEFHFSLGLCRHTSNFTPPTETYELQGTFISAFANEDGSGTELTNDLDISIDYGTEGALYEVGNNSSSSGYLFIKTLGFGIHLDSPSDDVQIDQPSIDEHGHQDESLNLSYQQEAHIGKLESQRVIEQEKDTRMVLHKVEMANKSPSDMMRFMSADVGALGAVNIGKIEKDAWFWLQKINFNLSGAGILKYSWTLREHYSLYKGLDDLAIEFRGGANTDCITFPYMPYVCGDDVTAFTISAWVYLDTEPTSNSYFIAAPYTDGAGSALLIGTTDRKVVFYTTRFSTSPGQWSSPADPFALTTWAHVILKYNLSVTSDPIIKINNVTQTLVEDVTPAGTLTSAKGANFFIGNVKTPTLNYSRCHDGKIRDVRYYPFLTADSQDSIIYNGGIYNPTVGNDGQVFQAFAVKSSRYAAYTDLTLTANTRIIDAHLGVVGTPNGSPIARTP